ncbi:taste receptor type 2 member 10-like [Hyla sarda]|uniref:taste receptor type 2 member 10-like n=1 Tax=Hyla sarda TaxID=327740 RepID=UPI0024C212FC|nr:taste receptor type 2 member 10-like [Hyla sarda]
MYGLKATEDTAMLTIPMPVFTAIAMVVGGIGSIFVLVHCVLQGTSQRLTPFFIIAFSLCMSNLVLICIQTTNEFLELLGETYSHLMTLLDRVSMSFLCYSLWLCTWLSLYYQVKIVPTLPRLYVWLKLRFIDVLPWFLVFSGLISATVGFCIVLDDTHGLLFNSSNLSTGNRQMTSNVYLLHVQLYCAFVSLSMLITFKSVMTIIFSLRRHVQHMMRQSSGFTSINVEAHYTAAKTVVTLLVFNFFLFLSQVIGYLRNDVYSVSILTSVTLSALLTICPYILINGNSKLKMEAKATFQRIFHELRNEKLSN